MPQVRLLRLVLPLPELHWFDSFLSPCFQFLIDSSFWTAAALASLAFYVQQTLNLSPDLRPIALIFCAALTFYNLDRVADARQPNSSEDQKLAFFRSPAILLLMLGSGIATVLLLVQAPIAVQQVSLVGLVSLAYGIPLLPIKQDGQTRWYRIKDIPGAKAWIVCGTIAFALTAVPLAYANQSFTPAAILTGIFLLVMTGSNAHVFDIRDLEDDRTQGVPTLPVLLGVLPTRILLTGMNAIGITALLGGWVNGWNVPSVAIVLPLTLLTLIYIWTVDPETGRSIYTVWIDGLLFLPALGVWL
ncbi:UbiA family prenyltransferase [Leptolyngbya ohadii]|uniref:UbiA family prenyltransferase n=1 Tax=Leptolyngbya ohadii TaxID=1962290 RepID=UPI000B59FCEF|nr:UbiA family prenyltransferase [Leptolyngbya ohadii]